MRRKMEAKKGGKPAHSGQATSGGHGVLGSHSQAMTKLVKGAGIHQQTRTPYLKASGKNRKDKIKDSPHLEEVGRGLGKDGKSGMMGKRTAKSAEPDNVPPKRDSIAITGKGTTKAGGIRQKGSKAGKRLQDVRL